MLMLKNGKHIQAVRYDFLIGFCDYMSEEDLLIIFSVSGTSPIMLDVSHTNSKIMLVTTNSNHKYQNVVDKTVVLPYVTQDPESSSISPILFDIFVELLVSYLSQDGFIDIE
jgi:DNA-binding MurR/RpiR family transcriptional regulator